MKPDDPDLNIKFVQEIEKNECLWNFCGPHVYKRQAQDKIWDDISHKIQEPVSVLRERWRNIRTAFYASEKLQNKKNASKSKKAYYLSNYLQFLLTAKNNIYDNTECSQSTTLFDNNDNESNQYKYDEPSEIINNNQNLLENSYPIPISSQIEPEIFNFDNNNEDYQSSSTFSKKESRKRKRKNTMSEMDIAIIDLAKSFKKDNIKDKDTNLLFLHSLLPDIKKLTDQQNRSFRIKILTLLDELLMKNEN